MSDETVYTGARVISGDQVLEDAALRVRKGVVQWVGAAAETASDGAVVSLRGKTIIPAIVNPHGHIGYMCGTTSHAAFYSRVNVIDHLHRLAYYGVSTFQSLGTDRDDTELGVRDDQRAGKLGERDVAELFTAGAGIVAPTPGGTNGGPFFAADVVHEATGPAEVREYVRGLAAKKVDAVKFWLDDRHGTKAKLGPGIYEAVIDEAHARGLIVAAHIYTLEEAKAVVRAGADIIAHLPRTGTDAELVSLLKEHNVAVCTSMAIQRPPGEAWLDEPAFADILPSEAVESLRSTIREYAPEPLFDTAAAYRGMEKTLVELAEAGVRLVFSADTGLLAQIIGFAEHRELEALVAAGLSPLAALRLATETSAELLGLADRGSLTAGKRADFIVLDEDPRRDITATRRIADVYLAGERVDRDGLRAGWQQG
ncbi:amidohydrolase family protein [Amycolatopsis sp. FDAARGOS 1241]|uniref:amidohydrolase family protein n=1 Tax=Amycolatopsis sp. FDAARGOS 1241 TaxID=2778070 RepID=UPI0019503642|nr:amidohydrolase family protein [Amycolatopsis sp. FDAARGOS 1241]QRP43205.1 amidohydrolase family protein [Amycolatopsis sp. FDAARGOS 1241]